MRYLTTAAVPGSPDLLVKKGIRLNEYARVYLEHPELQKMELPQLFRFVLCTPAELGLSDSCTLAQFLDQAQAYGFSLCHPLAAVSLRLHLTDQHESGNTILTGTHRAPDGSITVLSEPLSRDDTFPKGLYLRNVSGELWLRGYICDPGFLWSPSDVFALAQSHNS